MADSWKTDPQRRVKEASQCVRDYGLGRILDLDSTLDAVKSVLHRRDMIMNDERRLEACERLYLKLTQDIDAKVDLFLAAELYAGRKKLSNNIATAALIRELVFASVPRL